MRWSIGDSDNRAIMFEQSIKIAPICRGALDAGQGLGFHGTSVERLFG
jgi:hypothetical protein